MSSRHIFRYMVNFGSSSSSTNSVDNPASICALVFFGYWVKLVSVFPGSSESRSSFSVCVCGRLKLFHFPPGSIWCTLIGTQTGTWIFSRIGPEVVERITNDGCSPRHVYSNPPFCKNRSPRVPKRYRSVGF